MFISFPYMFRATVCPSPEETTVFMRHLVLVILYGWLSSIQNNKYQLSHKYSYFSWWWAYSRPKHVEKRNEHSTKTCAPSWLYLQDYTGMHGQQNIKYNKDSCVNMWGRHHTVLPVGLQNIFRHNFVPERTVDWVERQCDSSAASVLQCIVLLSPVLQSNLGSRTPRIMNNSAYEQNFRTQSVSDDVLCLELRTRKPSTSWSDKLGVSASAVFVEEWSSGKYESATPIGESVSCCVAFVHSNSLCLLLNFSVFCVFL